MEGRQILDAVLVANEADDSILRSNKGAFLCKLDIEKSYDHVEWHFLFSVLEKMGFGRKWIDGMKWCISTTSFSMLINGIPTGFFKSSRGLCQGDLLSPFLFVIVMEALNRLIERTVGGGGDSQQLFVWRAKGAEELNSLIFCSQMTT